MKEPSIVNVTQLQATWQVIADEDAAIWVGMGLPPTEIEFAWIEPDGTWLFGDVRHGVIARVDVNDERWRVRTWVLPEVPSDGAMARLALEVLIAEGPPVEPVYSGTRDRDSSGVLLWVRNAVTETRLWGALGTLVGRATTALEFEHVHGGGRLQASGTWDGLPFVYTIRYGVAALRVGGERPARQPLWWAEEQGNAFDGVDFNAVPAQFERLARRLEKAPFWYEFRARASSEDTQWPLLVGGWGHGVGQAYAAACHSRPELQIDPRPLAHDRRTFPSPPPRWPDGPEER